MYGDVGFRVVVSMEIVKLQIDDCCVEDVDLEVIASPMMRLRLNL